MTKPSGDWAFKFGGRRVVLTHDSITALSQPVDAVVSSDDNWLSHGGGISLAIWKAAGRQFSREMTQRRPALRLGEVRQAHRG